MVKEILKKDSEEKKFIILKSKFVYTGVFIPEKETDDFYVIIDKFGDEIVLNKSSIEIIKKFKEVEDRWILIYFLILFFCQKARWKGVVFTGKNDRL